MTVPRVLIVSWYRWPSSTRLAGALVAAGAYVEILCLDGHPLLKVAGVRRRWRYGLAPGARALRRAMTDGAPDLIIPCDEIAVDHLTRIHRTAGARRPALAEMAERALGSISAHERLSSREGLMTLARELDIRAPAGAAIHSADELELWLEQHGAPAFLKLDGTFGGDGVRELTNPAKARTLFAQMTRPPSLLEVAKQIFRRQLFTKAAARLGLLRPAASVQKTVTGRPANCSFACWRGELLANVSVEVLRTLGPRGVATHVRTIDSSDMTQAAAAIAGHLGLSGVYGLDFILDAAGKPWLIEMNARPTQISHLRLGPGRDLVGALITAVGGRPNPSQRPVDGQATLALFPHQLRAATPWMEDVDINDMPLDQPGVIAAFMPRVSPLRAFAAGLGGVVPRAARQQRDQALDMGDETASD